jgi:hypothetical protein
MNKGSRNAVIAIIVVVVIGVVIWLIARGGSTASNSTATQDPLGMANSQNAAPLPVSDTTKVSGSLSKYENAELGFSVQYPTTWQRGEMSNGVQFVVPIDSTQVTTVNRLEADINVTSGKCAFPPVTTVDSRATTTVQNLPVSMISMSNTVQGRSYFNRMYALQNGSVCYMFSFAYVALAPESKGLTGSNATQAKNNNNALKVTADAAFTEMVKSFQFVAPPAGQDETKAAPKK